MHIPIHMPMDMHVHMPVCTCLHAHAYLHMPICTCLHAHAYTHMPICTCLYAHAYAHVYGHACANAYAYAHAYMNMPVAHGYMNMPVAWLCHTSLPSLISTASRYSPYDGGFFDNNNNNNSQLPVRWIVHYLALLTATFRPPSPEPPPLRRSRPFPASLSSLVAQRPHTTHYPLSILISPNNEVGASVR